MKNEYIKVGNVVDTFSLNGSLIIYPTTDFPLERFKIGNELFLYNHDKNDVLTVQIAGVSSKSPYLIVKFKELNSISEAEQYLKYELVINREEASLDSGYFFESDVLNLDVFTDNDIYVGKVVKIEEYGPYKTLRVKRKGKNDVLIPYVEQFIEETNLKEKKIIIKPIEGLL
ncbi:MAG: ribosome maturation factor RimM [Bacilli bacterium]|jgi:16S rRNA processing protein RimM